MPATAAIDNETLDHLLSVVDDSLTLRSIRRLSKRGRRARRWNLRAISVGAVSARSWRECGMSESRRWRGLVCRLTAAAPSPRRWPAMHLRDASVAGSRD